LGKRKAGEEKQGIESIYIDAQKATFGGTRMERAALDYSARYRYGSARW